MTHCYQLSINEREEISLKENIKKIGTPIFLREKFTKRIFLLKSMNSK